MIVSKKGIIAAILLGILLPLLLFGSTLILFPDQVPVGTPIPKPGTRALPSEMNPIFSAIIWMGLAAVVSVFVVGIILMINRARLQLKNHINTP